MHRFDIPFPPSVNTYWRVFVRGKRIAKIMSAKGREFEKSACEVLKGWGGEQITTPVHLRIVLYRPCLRRRDLSNFIKAAEDALVKSGVLADDELVHHLEVVWGEKVEGGAATLYLAPFDGTPERFDPPKQGSLPD